MNAVSQTHLLGEQRKAVLRQEIMVILVNLGMFPLGISLALPAVTLDQLTNTDEPAYLNDKQASWFASVNFMICPFGALINALILDKIGRKRTVIAVNCITAIAWLLMALTVKDDSQSMFIQLMVSRCVAGICLGLGSAPTGVYAAEISLPKFRARLAMGTATAAAFGILFIYTLGYFIRGDYHQISWILLFYQCACLVALIPVIESPSWLLSKGREAEAKESLSYFRGLDAGETHEEVEAEFALLLNSVQVTKLTPFHKVALHPEVYKPLLIMCGLFLCQQCTGIFVLIAYAVEIAIEAGVLMDPVLCAVIIGTGRIFAIILLILFLEVWGRRPTIMFSAFIMGLSMFLLVGINWFTWLQIPYLPMATIVTYIFASALGLHTIPYFMISEIYPLNVRGACAGITGGFGMLMSFFALKSYLSMANAIGSTNVFAIYGVMCFVSIIYSYLLVPETRGKTLLEIEEYFRNGPLFANMAHKD